VGSEVSVRPYDQARDLEALRALNVEHQDFSRSLEPSWPEGKAVVDDYLAYLDREVASHDGAIFMGEVDETIAGFICVVSRLRGSPDDPAVFAWVHDIFVRPAHRRRGVATALMGAAESFVRSRGARELRLGVLDRNGPARVLYQRLGFRDYLRVLSRPLEP
jgi:GNAT superfamily N-acetyltransferase